MQRHRTALRVCVLGLSAAALGGCITMEQHAASEDIVEHLFDTWHEAAATGDYDAYFGKMTKDAVFLGTDRTERWTRKEFEAFARPYFNGPTAYGEGAWTYEPRRRAVSMNKYQDTAWIDEDLWNAKYGHCRGTGVAVRDPGGERWRIAHYSLTFLVPNEAAETVIGQIREYEPRQETSP